ncbi:WD40-repeat-containing domain protein, partial [Lentinula edodes]
TFDLLPFLMRSEWQEKGHITLPDAHTIVGLALSRDTRYLAVAYDIRVDIWDVKSTIKTVPLARYDSESKDDRVCTIAWSPESSRLTVSYLGGLVYVITMNDDSSLVAGFYHSAKAPNRRAMSVFLHKDLLAVALGKVVEIRIHLSNDTYHWGLLKTLPDTPIDKYLPIGDIQSIHAMTQNHILLSYENGVASIWNVGQLNPLTFHHETTMFLPGVINDICPAKGTILVTATGTYQIFLLGSQTVQSIFIPRDPQTKHPQAVSCAKFLSDDVIIGAGVGQLILWNADLGNRLQNLIYNDQ